MKHLTENKSFHSTCHQIDCSNTGYLLECDMVANLCMCLTHGTCYSSWCTPRVRILWLPLPEIIL